MTTLTLAPAIAETAEPSTPTSCRRVLENQARNWGSRIVGRRRHAAGVWWFDCVNERGEGNAGYLVSASDFPIETIPGHRLFEVRAGVYAFDGDADYMVLEYACPDLAWSAYNRGHLVGDTSIADVFGSFEVYYAYLGTGVRRHHAEIWDAMCVRESARPRVIAHREVAPARVSAAS